MKLIAITQMRMGSTRLPGKVLMDVNGSTLMDIHLQRISQATAVNKIIVATTVDQQDDAVAAHAADTGYTVYRGSVDDVLERFYFAARPEQPDYIVRVTGDCPLLDPALIDAVIIMAVVNEADYVSNVLEEHYPDGQDVEVFKWSALEKAYKEATLLSDREHVTPFIRRNSSYKGGDMFRSLNFPCIANYNSVRMTVDEAADLKLIKQLVASLGTDKSWKTYADHIIRNQLSEINSSIIRNEGFLKSIKADNNG